MVTSPNDKHSLSVTFWALSGTGCSEPVWWCLQSRSPSVSCCVGTGILNGGAQTSNATANQNKGRTARQYGGLFPRAHDYETVQRNAQAFYGLGGDPSDKHDPQRKEPGRRQSML